jgi:hypothetical protein
MFGKVLSFSNLEDYLREIGLLTEDPTKRFIKDFSLIDYLAVI